MSRLRVVTYINGGYPLGQHLFYPVYDLSIWPVVFPRCYKVLLGDVLVCDIKPAPGDDRYATLADHPVVSALAALEK